MISGVRKTGFLKFTLKEQKDKDTSQISANFLFLQTENCLTGTDTNILLRVGGAHSFYTGAQQG